MPSPRKLALTSLKTSAIILPIVTVTLFGLQWNANAVPTPKPTTQALSLSSSHASASSVVSTKVDTEQSAPVKSKSSSTSLLPSVKSVSLLPGINGLLPWPTAPKQILAEDPNNDPADAGPDSGPVTSDKAVVLYNTIQTETALAQEAVFKLPAAKAAAAAAAAKAKANTTTALNLRAESDLANHNMDNTVRGLYINGSMPGLVDVLLAEDGTDAYQILITHDQLEATADHTVTLAHQLQKQSELANAAAVQSMQDSAEADAEVASIENDIKVHTQNAEDAAVAYTEYLTLTGPQLLIGTDGCPIDAPDGTLRGGAEYVGIQVLCQKSVMEAKTPQAAIAIKWAFSKLGAPYACKGIGRMAPWRFDCSSLVTRAYWESSGIPLVRGGNSHTTRDIMPWDGYSLDPHYSEVAPQDISPGDLITTRSCTSEPCIYQHVTMAIADGFILETNSCGDVAHITRNPGYGPDAHFVVARRVNFLPGEPLPQVIIDQQREDALRNSSLKTPDTVTELAPVTGAAQDVPALP